jgi:hypothetical protein
VATYVRTLVAIVNNLAESIVINMTPSLVAGEANSLTKALDGVIVLADSASGRMQALTALDASLGASGVPLLGFVYQEGGTPAR